MINLKIVIMKLFVYFDISITKTGVFIDIFTYRKYNQMSSIVISADETGVAERKQRGRLTSNNHCKQFDE